MHLPPADLAARLPLRFTEIDLGRAKIGLFTLPDPDVLLDALTQEEFDRNDGRMPYWAVLWPSAMALGKAVLGSEFPAGRRVLDLGCGLGLAGLAALNRGADVTFLDWEESAVRLAKASAYAASSSPPPSTAWIAAVVLVPDTTAGSTSPGENPTTAPSRALTPTRRAKSAASTGPA